MPTFQRKPENSNHPEAQFRIMAMITVLQRDLGVRYNPACMTGPDNAIDSRNNFLHGPIDGHGGTCCSLPVLYLAIGRRLGYPLKLVEAKEHYFVRWDDSPRDRFNIESTSVGFSPRNDDYYRTWPNPITATEIAKGLFLQSFTPRQELAAFIAARGHCLLDNLRVVEAMEAYHHANKLDKKHNGFWAVATMVQRILANIRAGGLPRQFPFAEIIELASPTPVEEWEKWALPRAQEELLRIVELHRSNRERSVPSDLVLTVSI